MDIEGNLKAYLGAREPFGRYASFDYCFNYFQSFRESDRIHDLASPSQLEISCLQLGFFLASWGMLRGSSDLLKRSARNFAAVIEVIAASDPQLWEIDADSYGDSTIVILKQTAAQLKTALRETASDILVTKVMLGVWGCVPAFDTYFKKGFGVAAFGAKALRTISRFYQENAQVIEAYRVPTIDFETGGDTPRRYPRAKVLDMIFFVEGGYAAS